MGSGVRWKYVLPESRFFPLEIGGRDLSERIFDRNDTQKDKWRHEREDVFFSFPG